MTPLERKAMSLFGAMKQRCYNPKVPGFKSYGKRNITIYQEWLDAPRLFAKYAIEHGFSIGKQIHRIDGNKGYYPDNVEFITLEEHNYRHNGQKDFTCLCCYHTWQKRNFGDIKPRCCPRCKSYTWDKPKKEEGER